MNRLWRVVFVAFLAGESLLAAEHEFRFTKADAQSVAVLGEFNSWKAQPMSKGADGTWSAKVALPAGTHGYKFLVNGTDWTLDPNATARKTVDGVENSAVEVKKGGGSTGAGSIPRAAPLVPTPRPTATTPPAPRSAPSVAASPLKPGEVATIEAPLSAPQRAEATKEGNPPVAMAKVAIGLPAGFDPQTAWPILVISATVEASNIELLGAYQQAALDGGWIVLAADGPEKPKQDNNAWRLAMIGAGLDYLAAQWPSARTWPIACGGFSGGAKRSGFIAAALAKDGRRVIGMFMGGCNQDMATEGLHEYRPPASQFRNVPIFLSSGTSDTIATPQHHERVLGSMKGSNFRRVRLESFPGAHDVYPAHTREALQWFSSEQAAVAGSATPRPPSGLDALKKP